MRGVRVGDGVQGISERRSEVFGKFNFFWGGSGRGGQVEGGQVEGGQGRCERTSEVFVKIQEKNIFWGGRVGGVGGRSGLERKIEVFF